jgi:hypothetical protein
VYRQCARWNLVMFVLYLAALVLAVHLSQARRMTPPPNSGLQQTPASLTLGRRS